MSVLIMWENMLFCEEIYTAGKKFTLPPSLLAVTNLTSVSKFTVDLKVATTVVISIWYESL